MPDPLLRFREYWPVFVRAHESPAVRRVHFVATTAGIGCAVLGVFGRRLSLVLAAPAVALVPTWIARRFAGSASVELPAHAVFRVAASLKMWAMTLAGTMAREAASVVDASREEPLDMADEDHPYPPPNMVTDHTLH